MRILVLALALLLPSWARAGNQAPLEKPIKTFVNAVRYGKDSIALKQVDGPAQAQLLLGDAWSKATPAQQKEFIALFHVIFSAAAFPRLRENLQKVEAIGYGAASLKGDRAELTSTLVIQHPLKKEELKVRYVLSKNSSGWQLVDVTLGPDQSLLTTVREDQVAPLYAKGGWEGLLSALRTRVEELKKKS